MTETITNLINQVIKRQQEILQIIIGCNCVETTTTTTAAPAVAAKVNFVKPTVEIPFGTRYPTTYKPIVPEVKPFVQDKTTLFKETVPGVENEAFKTPEASLPTKN